MGYIIAPLVIIFVCVLIFGIAFAIPLMKGKIREKKKILVVEREAQICNILEELLKKNDYDVVFAHDGAVGFKMVNKERPDLVIMNFDLPTFSGESLCKAIRQNEDICEIPIIMAAAKKSDIDRMAHKVMGTDIKDLMGADSYILMPYFGNKLLSEVGKLLQGK